MHRKRGMRPEGLGRGASRVPRIFGWGLVRLVWVAHAVTGSNYGCSVSVPVGLSFEAAVLPPSGPSGTSGDDNVDGAHID